jgi:uncharacterized protein (TIGR02001 family)
MLPIITLFTAMITLFFCASNVWAEEEKPTAEGDIAFLSQYIWRGFALSQDSLVIQPSATMGYKGFSANIWANLDTDFQPPGNTSSGKNEVSEIDFTLAYDHSFGDFGLGVGYIYYGFDGLSIDGVTDTQEFYASLGWDGFLQPSLTVYRDFDVFDSWYFLLGLSHSFALPKDMSLDLAGSVSYYSYDDLYEVNDPTKKYSNFHDGLLSVSIVIPFAKYFTCTPIISYAFPLTSESKDLLKGGSFDEKGDHFFGGISFSIAF